MHGARGIYTEECVLKRGLDILSKCPTGILPVDENFFVRGQDDPATLGRDAQAT
jgi:hypothetical protein